MKKLVAMGLGWLACGVIMRAAEAEFSKAVRAEEFAAAGLGKLSPDEVARLDGLVREYKSGALAAAKREAAVAAEARGTAEAKAARAEAETQAAKAEAAKAKKAEGGLLARAKVRLTPGTEIEYATVESRIAGNFTGWEGRAVLTLENGQRWQIANGGTYMTPALPSPNVKIVPANLGGFWMAIEGVANRVKVLPLGGR